MDEVMEILNEVRPDVDFEKEKKLIDDSILDSFDIISIVSELNEHFGISIDADYLEAENFNSAEAILELVKKLQDA